VVAGGDKLGRIAMRGRKGDKHVTLSDT